MFETLKERYQNVSISSHSSPASPHESKEASQARQTLFVFSGLVLMAAGLIFNQSALASGEVVSANKAFNYVSVMPGDTLWNLSETYAEGKSQQDWIAEIILLNNLESATLTAGDKLALP